MLRLSVRANVLPARSRFEVLSQVGPRWGWAVSHASTVDGSSEWGAYTDLPSACHCTAASVASFRRLHRPPNRRSLALMSTPPQHQPQAGAVGAAGSPESPPEEYILSPSGWFPSPQSLQFDVGHPSPHRRSAACPAQQPSQQQPTPRKMFAFEQPIHTPDGDAHTGQPSRTSAAEIPAIDDCSEEYASGGGGSSLFAQALNSTRVGLSARNLQTPMTAAMNMMQLRRHPNGLRMDPLGGQHQTSSRSFDSNDSTPLGSPAAVSNGIVPPVLPPRPPPRIPSVPHLVRLGGATSGAQQQRPSNSNPSTPTVAQSTPSTTRSLPSAMMPSLSDLVSPAESADVRFENWETSPKSLAAASVSASSARSASMPTTPLSSVVPLSIDSALPSPAPLSAAWKALLARQESIEHVRSDPAVHELISAGVPKQARAELWKLLSGATEERRRYPKGYYNRLLALHRLQGSVYDDEIRRDLHRSLPGIDLFNPRKQPASDQTSSGPIQPGQQAQPSLTGTGGLAKLNRILCAYATRNKTIGYCQGLNHIAGCLLTLLDEESCFWIFCCIVETRSGYYCKSMCGLEVDQQVFSSLVSYFLPSVYDHLRQFDVTIPSFTVSWFVCLFVEAPLECTRMDEIYAVWDHLFLYGDEFLFAFSLALLQSKEAEILAKKDTGELLEFLLHSGFKRGSGNGSGIGPANGTTDGTSDGDSFSPSPLSVHKLLHTDVPQLGSLAREISSLREYHRNLVLAKAKVLHPHTAARLAETYKFAGGAQEIQKLWMAFLAPSPWSILLQGSLTSLVKFHSFCELVFPESVRRRWRDLSFFSGFGERLFQTIDSDGRGEITFEAFLAAVSLFTRPGAEEERCRFAYRFFDVDGDGMVGRAEMLEMFKCFHRMYSGRPIEERRKEVEKRKLQKDAGKSKAVDAAINGAAANDAALPSNSTSNGILSAISPPPADDCEAVSALFVQMMFQKAADLTLASSSSHGSHATVLSGLYATGLNYSLFRRIISLHPFSQLTFGLTLSESRSIVKSNSQPSQNGSTIASGASSPVTSVPSTPLITQPRAIHRSSDASSVGSSIAAAMAIANRNGAAASAATTTAAYSLLSASDRASPAISSSPPANFDGAGLASGSSISLSRRGSFNMAAAATGSASTSAATAAAVLATPMMPTRKNSLTGGLASAHAPLRATQSASTVL
jgi:hypothetical protein